MIRLSNAGLDATLSGANVTLTVRYRVLVDPIDRHFAMNGVRYTERVRVLGVDAGAGIPDQIVATRFFNDINDDIANGSGEFINSSAGVSVQALTRERSITLSRAALNEDPAVGDNDEIRCEISIHSTTFPTVANPIGTATDGTPLQGGADGTLFVLINTNQRTLAG